MKKSLKFSFSSFAQTMRQSLTVALLCMTMQSAHSSAPKVDYTPRFIDVTGVERTDSCTRISIELNHFPGSWVRIHSNTYLTTENDTLTRYNLIGQVNIPLDEKIRMPKSGYQYGELLFEKLPDDVNVVDMIIEGLDEPSENILGIHLDETYEKVIPKFTTAADLMDSKERSTDIWDGIAPSDYKDMPFYKKDGIAHIRGRIDGYTPRIDLTNFTIRTQNDLTGETKMQVGKVNPDGTFSIDIPLQYPQFDYFSFGNLSRSIFIAPGDTIDFVASMKTKYKPNRTAEQEYFGYVGNLGYASLVNILTDSINNRYNLNSIYRKYAVADTDSMKQMTIESSKKISSLLDSTITDLKQFLFDIPVSKEVKDMAAAYAIGKIWVMVEDMDMRYRTTKGDTLDYSLFLAPHKEYLSLIYDNPLMICNGFVLPNRWKYNNLFHPSVMAAAGVYSSREEAAERKDSYEMLNLIDKENEEKCGIGNCFAAQLARTAYLIEHMEMVANLEDNYLPEASKLVSNLIRKNENQVLNETLMDKYAELAINLSPSNNASSKNAITIDINDSTDPLIAIIAPYLGNVLFVDFWGIGCGPCRASMLKQKVVLEHYADKPFKALYVAKASEREACEKWLTKENIKGEHIYISENTWRALNGKLNFSGIPFSILIGKDGKEIIATNLNLTVNDPTVEKALKE